MISAPSTSPTGPWASSPRSPHSGSLAPGDRRHSGRAFPRRQCLELGTRPSYSAGRCPGSHPPLRGGRSPAAPRPGRPRLRPDLRPSGRGDGAGGERRRPLAHPGGKLPGQGPQAGDDPLRLRPRCLHLPGGRADPGYRRGGRRGPSALSGLHGLEQRGRPSSLGNPDLPLRLRLRQPHGPWRKGGEGACHPPHQGSARALCQGCPATPSSLY